MATITRDEPDAGASQPAPTTTSAGSRTPRFSLGNLPNTYVWALGTATVLVVLVVSLLVWGAAMVFPADVGRDIGGVIDAATSWLAREGDWLWDIVKIVILAVLLNLEDLLIWIPWPALVLGTGLLAWRTAGVQVALFAIIGLLAMGFVGLWETAMETLALVVTSVALSVILGVPLGILGARNNLADSIMRPMLDGMQTMPSFVYLVPAIFFFSLGNVPAVMATIIYALPPAIRLTNLGIRQVSPETIEAAHSFGATPWQLLMKVQIPMALPTIMAGINQTTMMALAMVVVGALVGAGGLGEAVLRSLGRQEAGNAALAGMGIVIVAIIIDRVTQALARGQQEALSAGR